MASPLSAASMNAASTAAHAAGTDTDTGTGTGMKAGTQAGIQAEGGEAADAAGGALLVLPTLPAAATVRAEARGNSEAKEEGGEDGEERCTLPGFTTLWLSYSPPPPAPPPCSPRDAAPMGWRG